MTKLCAFCGGPFDTRDHVPSKVFLDPPYNPDLPIVPACYKCNNGFSKDELYLACLIDSTVTGTTIPDFDNRLKIAKNLATNPTLAESIEKQKNVDFIGNITWNPDHTRVLNVIKKLARGHSLYELGLVQLNEPYLQLVRPIVLLSEEELFLFNNPPLTNYYPEIGSRSFLRLFRPRPMDVGGGWIEVQAGRYRYNVTQNRGTIVRICLSEYLTCIIAWE